MNPSSWWPASGLTPQAGIYCAVVTGFTISALRAREQPRAVMPQAGFVEHVGEEHVCPNVEAALVRAQHVRERLTRTADV